MTSTSTGFTCRLRFSCRGRSFGQDDCRFRGGLLRSMGCFVHKIHRRYTETLSPTDGPRSASRQFNCTVHSSNKFNPEAPLLTQCEDPMQDSSTADQKGAATVAAEHPGSPLGQRPHQKQLLLLATSTQTTSHMHLVPGCTITQQCTLSPLAGKCMAAP